MKKLLVDCSTGKQTLVDLTADEVAQLKRDQAEAARLEEARASQPTVEKRLAALEAALLKR